MSARSVRFPMCSNPAPESLCHLEHQLSGVGAVSRRCRPRARIARTHESAIACASVIACEWKPFAQTPGFRKQDPARAVELMTQRETWLEDSRGIEQNRKRLWQGLLVQQSPGLAQRCATVNRRRYARLANAWLSGDIHRPAGCRLEQRHRALARSSPRPSCHGGDWTSWHFLNRSCSNTRVRLHCCCRSVGRSATAGKAIQNGFMGAYFRDRQLHSTTGNRSAFMTSIRKAVPARRIRTPLLTARNLSSDRF